MLITVINMAVSHCRFNRETGASPMSNEQPSMSLHPQLETISTWVEPVLNCADAGNKLTLHVSEAFHYHGFDAPGGVALGFRLLQKALACLAPEEAWPDRRQLTLFTSFPGRGLKDTMEMTTRMISDGRYCVETDFCDKRVQEGVCGGFYFRFGYRGREVELAPVEGYPGREFVRLGRASKQPDFDAEQAVAWTRAKFALANTLLTASANAVLRVL